MQPNSELLVNSEGTTLILTHKDDLCSNQSLDYIFRINPKSLFKRRRSDIDSQPSQEQRQCRLSIPSGNARVEKFFSVLFSYI